MQSLNVFEKGIWYLEACLSYYAGACGYIMLYIAALLFVALKGSERERSIFLPSGIFLLVTVFNPVAPVILDHFFDVNSEYYRFFWIAPLVILIPYVLVKLIMEADTRKKKLAISAFAIMIFFFAGNFLYKEGVKFADNIYKMPFSS